MRKAVGLASNLDLDLGLVFSGAFSLTVLTLLLRVMVSSDWVNEAIAS